MATIRQKDAPSLLINGDFNSGLAGWEVTRGLVAHGISSIVGNNSELSLKNTGAPLYVAKLIRPDAVGVDQYAEIAQTINRKDIWSYPSEHYVVNALAVPTSPNTVRIEFPFDTTVDGRQIASEEFAAYQTNGYGEKIPLAEGSELLTEVPQYPDLNGVFRAGATVKYNSEGQDRYFVQASPTKQIPWIASHENASAAFFTENTNTFIRISRENTFERKIKEPGETQAVGIKPGDTLIIENIEERAGVLFGPTSGLRRRTDYSVCKVTSIETSATSTKLGVSPIAGSPFIPSGLPNLTITRWYVFPKFRVNFVKYVYAYRYEYTLAVSVYPNNILSNAFDSFLVEPLLDIVDPISGNEVPITISNTNVPLLNSPNPTATAFGESAPTSEEPQVATTFRRHIFKFISEFTIPPKGNLRLRFRYQPLNLLTEEYPAEFELGDIVLYKGDFITRHDFSYLDDKSDTSTTLPADQKTSLDRLLHKVDEYSGVVPKGTVILYTGPRCPPGFKRLDSIANSETDGIWSDKRQTSSGSFETVPALPPPEGASYDGIRNRTILTWTNVPGVLLDANNRPIPVKGVSKQVLMPTPGGAPTFGESELVTVDIPQVKVQPGMSLRIRSSRDRGIHDLKNRRYDYSSMVRQVSITRQHFTGVWSSDDQRYDGITYPLYIPFSAIGPADSVVPPLGPLFLPTSTSLTYNNQNITSLTIQGVNQTETTETVSRFRLPGLLTAEYLTTLPFGSNIPDANGTVAWLATNLGEVPINGVYGNPVVVSINDGMEVLDLNNTEFDPIPDIGDVFSLTLMYRAAGDRSSVNVPLKLVRNITIPPSSSGSVTVNYTYMLQRLLVEVTSASPDKVTVKRAGGGTINSYVGPVSSYLTGNSFVAELGSGANTSLFTSAFHPLIVEPVPSNSVFKGFRQGAGDPPRNDANAYAYLSDAKLFDPNSVVVNKAVIRGQAMWSVRAFTTILNVSVFGDVTEDVRANNVEGIVLEPSGYIRYGDTVIDDLYPDGRIRGFSYGSMGHSHEISQGNATFNENIAPRVATYKESEVTPTPVARKHGHGFFPKYFYPMPQFAAYLMCEKI